MKKLFISLGITLLIGSHSVNAATKGDCKDPNFDNLGSSSIYNELENLARFSGFHSFPSPAPAGLMGYGANPDSICYDIVATYFTHKASKKDYVMYTTHDDYCDGGNTFGVIIDMHIYNSKKLEDSIVADIGDSDVVCTKKKRK